MKRTKLTEMPMARAAAALSPAVRTIRPQRVLRSAQASRIGERDADEKQRIDLQRAVQVGVVGPESPSGIEPSRGAVGWM